MITLKLLTFITLYEYLSVAGVLRIRLTTELGFNHPHGGQIEIKCSEKRTNNQLLLQIIPCTSGNCSSEKEHR